MSAAILELKAIEALVDKKGRDRVRLLSTLLDELGQMLHRIAWELRPASLDELGLTAALENYVVEWGHKHTMQADFHCSDIHLDKRSNEIRTTIYRVIQEGLTNIAKHATNATNVSVVIGVAEHTLHLAIEDNGQGFDPTASSTRLGLAGMRERLLLVGGRLAIESSPECRHHDFCTNSHTLREGRSVNEKTRVALADDHPIILSGLGNLIEAESDLELVGQAASGQSALKMIREKLPDVAIVDISMPEINGIVLARRLAEECPSVRILILTLYEERSFLKQAMAAGVRGYVLKRSAAENLVHAIRTVRRGEFYVDPSLANGVQENIATRSERAPQAGGSVGLTEREASVLKYSARGLTTKEIAARLELSGKTVETYKSRAAEKLNLRTRAEIVRFASAQGWLEEF